MDWNDLRLFAAVARHGTLAAAARETGVSHPTLGRRMRALEEALGRELFRRARNGYRLTEAGREIVEGLAGVEERIEALGVQTREALPVTVSAGTWTMHALAPSLGGLAADVRLRLSTAERTLDIARRETLIGVRNREPTEQGVAARRVGTVRFAPFAVDGNVRRWVHVTRDTPSARWTGEAVRASPEAAIEVSDPRTALDLARAGLARALLPTFVGDRDAALSRVGPAVEELAHAQWLVVHGTERHARPVRRVVERVAEILRGLHREDR